MRRSSWASSTPRSAFSGDNDPVFVGLDGTEFSVASYLACVQVLSAWLGRA